MYALLMNTQIDLRMIGHMNKKLLTFEIFINPSTIVRDENEQNKGCTTCMHWTWQCKHIIFKCIYFTIKL